MTSQSASGDHLYRRNGLQARLIRSYLLVTLGSIFTLEGIRLLLSLATGWPNQYAVLLIVDGSLLILLPPIGGLFSFIAVRGLVTRIRRLTQATRDFADGHYEVRLPALQFDEIGQLEQHFNDMAVRLVETIRQQQALAAQNARFAERTRISRDLHDNVKQQLFAASMHISRALALLDATSLASTQLIEADDLVYKARQDLTMLIHALRPVMAAENRFPASLQEHLTAWGRHHAIMVTVQSDVAAALPAAFNEVFWRVLREALANIVRHSQATSVEVRFVYQQQDATLTITDNGKGFAPEGTQHTGIGLQSLREQLATLGGTLDVTSEIGEGASLSARCIVPQHSGMS